MKASYWRIQGGARNVLPPSPISFIFMQFSEKSDQIIAFHVHTRINPGSATASNLKGSKVWMLLRVKKTLLKTNLEIHFEKIMISFGIELQTKPIPIFFSVIAILFSKEKTIILNETGNRFSFLRVDVNPDIETALNCYLLEMDPGPDDWVRCQRYPAWRCRTDPGMMRSRSIGWHSSCYLKRKWWTVYQR